MKGFTRKISCVNMSTYATLEQGRTFVQTVAKASRRVDQEQPTDGSTILNDKSSGGQGRVIEDHLMTLKVNINALFAMMSPTATLNIANT